MQDSRPAHHTPPAPSHARYASNRQRPASHLHQQATVVELAYHDIHVGAAQVQAQALGPLPHSLHRVLDAWGAAGREHRRVGGRVVGEWDELTTMHAVHM